MENTETLKKVAKILLDWSIEAGEFEIAETLFKYFNIPISNKTLYKIKSQTSFISYKHLKNHNQSVSIPINFMNMLIKSKYTYDKESGYCYKY